MCRSSVPCQSCFPRKACPAAVVFRSVGHHPLLTLPWWPWWPRSRCHRARDGVSGRGGQMPVCRRARYPPLAARSPPGEPGLCAWAIVHHPPPLEPVLPGGLMPQPEPGTPPARLPLSRATGIQRGCWLPGEEQTAGSWGMLMGGARPATLGSQTRVWHMKSHRNSAPSITELKVKTSPASQKMHMPTFPFSTATENGLGRQ